MLDIYRNIKELRIEHGWSQETLAKKMGYSDKSMIAKIENGKVDLPQSKVIMFAEILGVSPSHLMGWDAEPGGAVDGELNEAVKTLNPEQKNYLLKIARMFAGDK